jgi:hypothetical protein
MYVAVAVLVRKEAAEWFAASEAAVKDVEDKVGRAWHGPLPMLRLIMALVDLDKMRHAHMSWNDISNSRTTIDDQKSIKKRVTTVWELLVAEWNDPDLSCACRMSLLPILGPKCRVRRHVDDKS